MAKKFTRSNLEKLKEQIDKLEPIEHTQIYNIMKQSELQVTKTQNGVLVSADKIEDKTLEEVEKYVVFCLDQQTRMVEDMKTRKTYERMVHD